MTDTSTAIDPHRTLAELVRERPSRARVLEQHGLDYCCRGWRSLADACAEARIDAGVVAGELAAAAEPAAPPADGLPPAALVDHIEASHHAYLWAELPLLEELAAKVASVHGERHGELHDAAALVRVLRADLEPHMVKEERVLFPAIRRLAAGQPEGAWVRAPIQVMRTDHEEVGALLAELRAVTYGYEIPADACASYSSLYERLPALEADTFRHVHLENNVLFPAVEGLLSGSGRAAH